MKPFLFTAGALGLIALAVLVAWGFKTFIQWGWAKLKSISEPEK